MAKNKMNKTLLEEVQQNPQVQEILDQIQNLGKEAENKRRGIENFKREIEQRELQVDGLRQEAEQELARGQDPMPSLDQVAGLENEVRVMQGLLDNGADPAQQEEVQIEKLKKELQREIVRAVSSSQNLADMLEGLEVRIQDLKDYMDGWAQSEEEAFRSFGVSRAGSSRFVIRDKKLSRFCKSMAYL